MLFSGMAAVRGFVSRAMAGGNQASHLSFKVPPESVLSRLPSRTNNEIKTLFGAAAVEPDYAPARHRAADHALRMARMTGADTQPFLVLLMQSQLELNSVTAVSETLTQIAPEVLETDPELREQVDAVKDWLNQNAQEVDQRMKEEILDPRIHLAADVGPIETKYADVQEKGLDWVNSLGEESMADYHEALSSLAALGKERIQATVAERYQVPYAMLHDFFIGASDEEAAKIAMTFETIGAHRQVDKGVAPVSNLYKMEDTVNAYHSLAQLGRKFKLGEKVTPEEVIKTIKDIQGHVTRAYMYRKKPDGSYSLLPAGMLRKDVIATSDVVFCHPDEVPERLDRVAKMLIDYMESGNLSSSAGAAWLHHQLTAIHPFEDGNGRTARFFAMLFSIVQDDVPLAIHGGELKAQYKNAYYEAEGMNKVEGTPLPMKIEKLTKVFTEHSIEKVNSLANIASRIDVEAVKAKKYTESADVVYSRCAVPFEPASVDAPLVKKTEAAKMDLDHAPAFVHPDFMSEMITLPEPPEVLKPVKKRSANQRIGKPRVEAPRSSVDTNEPNPAQPPISFIAKQALLTQSSVLAKVMASGAIEKLGKFDLNTSVTAPAVSLNPTRQASFNKVPKARSVEGSKRERHAGDDIMDALNRRG